MRKLYIAQVIGAPNSNTIKFKLDSIKVISKIGHYVVSPEDSPTQDTYLLPKKSLNKEMLVLPELTVYYSEDVNNCEKWISDKTQKLIDPLFNLVDLKNFNDI